MHYVENPCTDTCPQVRRDGRSGAKWIRNAAQYIMRYREAETAYAKAALADKYPDMFWAHHIFLQDAHPTKYAIEAYLLARETNAQVGFRCNADPSIVRAYEAVFFNIRHKLRHPAYVINVVLGSAVHRGITDRQYDLMWKLYAYMGGPYVLDMMIQKLPAPAWAPDSNAVPSFWQDVAVASMRMKAAQSSVAVPVNNQNHLAILDLYNKYVEIERTTESQGQAKEAVLENIQAMMRGLPYSVAGQGSREQERQHPLFLRSSGAELRYQETMLAAAGVDMPNIESLDEVQYPELQDHENTQPTG